MWHEDDTPRNTIFFDVRNCFFCESGDGRAYQVLYCQALSSIESL